jgi:hypothetical protein
VVVTLTANILPLFWFVVHEILFVTLQSFLYFLFVVSGALFTTKEIRDVVHVQQKWRKRWITTVVAATIGHTMTFAISVDAMQKLFDCFVSCINRWQYRYLDGCDCIFTAKVHCKIFAQLYKVCLIHFVLDVIDRNDCVGRFVSAEQFG